MKTTIIKCEICERRLYVQGFGVHLKKHNIGIKDYYDIYVLDDKNNQYCDYCQTEKTVFDGLIKGYRKFCSCKCAQNSPQTKQKQHITHIGRSRPDLVGDKNPAKKESSRAKIRMALMGNQHTLGKKYTSAQKKNVSDAIKKSWKDNISRKASLLLTWLNPKHYKHGYYFSQKNNKNFYYRSSYELIAFEMLDNNPNVIKYSVNNIAIKYLYKDETKHYFPDLHIEYKDGVKEICEIKPSRMIFIDDKNKYKFRACSEYCDKKGIKFSIWTESELGIVV